MKSFNAAEEQTKSDTERGKRLQLLLNHFHFLFVWFHILFLLSSSLSPNGGETFCFGSLPIVWYFTVWKETKKEGHVNQTEAAGHETMRSFESRENAERKQTVASANALKYTKHELIEPQTQSIEKCCTGHRCRHVRRFNQGSRRLMDTPALVTPANI